MLLQQGTGRLGTLLLGTFGQFVGLRIAISLAAPAIVYLTNHGPKTRKKADFRGGKYRLGDSKLPSAPDRKGIRRLELSRSLAFAEVRKELHFR